ATSTPRYTTLNLKVDPGKGADKGGIHWHIAAENEVRYASLGDKREVIIWTRVKRPDGSFRQFTNRALASSTGEEQQERVLDCVDCHNRATHIYEQPGDAVDRRMRLGRINRSLPYVKREGLAAITIDYANQPAAMEGITNHMWGFYQRRHPDVAVSEAPMIDSAVAALQEIYVRNIHHGMNITWGSYPSHIGHVGTSGCFRCHNANMTDDAGNSVSSDCGLCHSILAFRSERPFDYLQPIDTTLPDYLMRQYLQHEFLDYTEE
ncbi:MAG: hypothetical protein OEW00_14485, partial [candidate division Zixibacteria bacterium]|nr:hypothetical protein [candidate division Zixibacteria bacterium]